LGKKADRFPIRGEVIYELAGTFEEDAPIKEANRWYPTLRRNSVMTNKRFTVCLAAVALAVLVLTAGIAAADVQSGTWKMNPGKSKYEGPTPKSATVKIESNEQEIRLDAQGIGANNQETHTQFQAKFDGKDYPATGLPAGDHVSVKRIDAHTIQVIMKQGSQALLTVTSVVSKDGKTRTSTYQGKDAQGREMHTVVVYDKQ
jgi:hypothetical protein